MYCNFNKYLLKKIPKQFDPIYKFLYAFLKCVVISGHHPRENFYLKHKEIACFVENVGKDVQNAIRKHCNRDIIAPESTDYSLEHLQMF